MRTGTAILDVLTNSIGALLILVVLFVKLMGEDSASRSLPLASTDQGLCSSPRLYLQIDLALAAPESLQLSIEERPRGQPAAPAAFEWYPIAEPAPPVLPQATVAAYAPGRPLVLWSPARPGTTWTIRARPLQKPSPGDAVDVTLIVAGAHLDPVLPVPSGPRRHYRARWLAAGEDVRIEPAATRPQRLPVKSRFFTDDVHLTLELPDHARPDPGGAVCDES